MVTRIVQLFIMLVTMAMFSHLGTQGQTLPSASHPNTHGWKDLFQRDLSNTTYEPGGWVFEKGVFYAKDHGNIWTKKAYGNFVLDLEFKVARQANSGIFLRTGDIRNVLSAIEVQVHETSDRNPRGMVGAIYDIQVPSRDMSKPVGEWNHYTITCNDNKIYVVFNGTQVIDIDLNRWTEPHKNPDGTRNKFATALKNYPRIGPIGLQGIHGREGQPVWYRNLKIKTFK